MDPTVPQLLAAGRIEAVPADLPAARARLAVAQRHLVTADTLSGVTDLTRSVNEFQRMRRRRNKSEYDDIVLGSQDVTTDLVHATNIVSAALASLPLGP